MKGPRWIRRDLRNQRRGASAGALIRLRGNHPMLPVMIAATVPDAALVDALVSDPQVRGERIMREGAGLAHSLLFLTPPALDMVAKILKPLSHGSRLKLQATLAGRSPQQAAAILSPMRKWLDARRR